jgi:hypothetical protein
MPEMIIARSKRRGHKYRNHFCLKLHELDVDTTGRNDWTWSSTPRGLGFQTSAFVKRCPMPARSHRPELAYGIAPGRHWTGREGGNRGKSSWRQLWLQATVPVSSLSVEGDDQSGGDTGQMPDGVADTSAYLIADCAEMKLIGRFGNAPPHRLRSKATV